MVIRYKIINLLIVTVFCSAGFGAEMSLKYFNNEKYEEVKISEVQKNHVSSSCLKNGKPSCEAWKTFSGKPKAQSESKVPLAGDPAAKYCWDVGAKNRILKSADNKQYDYCVFNDGSMIDAWDLYYKHFPPTAPKK